MAATDARKFNLRALVSPALWGCAALLAVVSVAMAVNSETGQKQLAMARAAFDPKPEPPKPAVPNEAQLLARTKEFENETRRLADSMRVLSADRDRLMARIATLERTIEDVTGSLATERLRAARNAAAVPVTQNPPVAAAPATVAAAPVVAPAPPAAIAAPAPPPVPIAAPAPPQIVASPPPAQIAALPAVPPPAEVVPRAPATAPTVTLTPSLPAPAPARPSAAAGVRPHDPTPVPVQAVRPDSVPAWTTSIDTQTLALAPAPPAVPAPKPPAAAPGRAEFGIDVGRASNIDALRALWVSLTEKYEALEKLRPSVVLYESPSAPPELRLVLGPLPNVASAAKLCASLSTAGINCQTALYDGQKLAWR